MSLESKLSSSTFALKIVYLFLLKQKYKPHVENCEESKNAYNPASQKLKPTGNIFFVAVPMHCLSSWAGDRTRTMAVTQDTAVITLDL